MKKTINIDFSKVLVTALRMAIGWHFLYEGISKILIKDWSSYSYLAYSSGPLSDFYHWIASSQVILKIVDILNIYGLLLIGLALFIGLFSKIAALAGTLLLTLYYFAYPPFGNSLLMAADGDHLFIVDKIFIEAIALLFLVFVRERGFGIDIFIELIKKAREKSQIQKDEEVPFSESRREALKNIASIPMLGILGSFTFHGYKKFGVDVMSGATIQLSQASLDELKGVPPKGKIGKFEISRLVLGGNLIAGFSHARDLLYTNSLFKAYNTEQKIYETLILAEKAGINTINIPFPSCALMSKYKKVTGSKIIVISQVAPNMRTGDIYDQINRAIDFGIDIIQIQGNQCDFMVRDNRIEVIGNMLEKIKSNGYIAGLAAHTVDALIATEAEGIIPDYYMKAMHHDQYWSAHPLENRVPFEVDGKKYLDHDKFHDNMFCLFPDRTVEFVSKSKIPVMGFKVLAAGAILPQDGFKWAFENGADFICTGMFDFQIVNDVNICIDTLSNLGNRKREWYS